jgi:hypothetical protein
MKIDIPDVPEGDRIYRNVKICGKPREPSDREIKLFMTLIQSIVKRSRIENENESSRLHQSIQ